MNLDSPIEAINGVGATYAASMHARGITTVRDCLWMTPLKYVDFTHPVPIASIQAGQQVVVHATIESSVLERTKKRQMTIVRATLEDESSTITALWFNQPFLKPTLVPHKHGYFFGYVVHDMRFGKVLRNPEILFSENPFPQSHYSQKTGLSSGKFAKIITSILPLLNDVQDPIEAKIRQIYDLVSLADALRMVHAPQSMSEVTKGRERLALDELWSIMLLSRLQKRQDGHKKAHAIQQLASRIVDDIKQLPFTLTHGQKEALADIAKDINRPIPMRRLLNGDVGSGKTIVAFLVARQVLAAGFSTVLLAPTTVLAEQHYQNWRKNFPDSQSVFITSGKYQINDEVVKKQNVIEFLAQSPHCFICGTHAVLFQDRSIVDTIGLVIVDEQHRFGVMQRAAFMERSIDSTPHLLSMSATPIPRTAALVLYGDLDISLLPEKPQERQAIKTKLASEKSRPVVYQFIDQLIEKGQQVYIVCPQIGLNEEQPESGQLFSFVEEKKAVTEEYDRLRLSIFNHRRIGLLHGRMKQQEKQDVLDRFREGALDILVTTSVIEVGVDVPNATVMVIENAEYFGLAQLHQLRGRVGRGSEQSVCFLFARDWNEQSKRRLDMLIQYEDGFALAEQDLQLRGPGELYGTVQAGFSPFRFASLSDSKLVSRAQSLTQDILDIPQAEWSVVLQEWITARVKSMHNE